MVSMNRRRKKKVHREGPKIFDTDRRIRISKHFSTSVAVGAGMGWEVGGRRCEARDFRGRDDQLQEFRMLKKSFKKKLTKKLTFGCFYSFFGFLVYTICAASSPKCSSNHFRLPFKGTGGTPRLTHLRRIAN
jgi:hypothetical protein